MNRGALACFALACAAAPAGASIPVDLEERSRAGLQHVCVDREPSAYDYVPCDEQVGGSDGEYTGSECVPAGLPPACTVDFVQKVRLTGKLLVIQDDQAQDPVGVPRLATGIVLDVNARGRKTRLIELFDGAVIGHWNGFLEAFLVDTAASIQFTNAEESAYNLASENLVELGLELREIAQEAWPAIDLSQSVAVLTSVVRESPKKSSGHSDPADPLASAASFKVVIRFARLRP